MKKVSEECENKSEQVTELHEKLKHLKESSSSNEADRQVRTFVFEMIVKISICNLLSFHSLYKGVDTGVGVGASGAFSPHPQILKFACTHISLYLSPLPPLSKLCLYMPLP